MTTEFKMVPVEPTEEMMAVEVSPALCLGNPETPRVAQWRRGVYKAMLAAAPASPQAAQPVAYIAKRVTPTGNARLDRPLLSLVGGEGWGPAFECVPLYTHADAAEVERHAPPQPIYDEAKEKGLFAEFSRRIVAHDAANFPIRWCDCVPDEEIEEHLNTWLACAQSRAKAGEVGCV